MRAARLPVGDGFASAAADLAGEVVLRDAAEVAEVAQLLAGQAGAAQDQGQADHLLQLGFVADQGGRFGARRAVGQDDSRPLEHHAGQAAMRVLPALGRLDANLRRATDWAPVGGSHVTSP